MRLIDVSGCWLTGQPDRHGLKSSRMLKTQYSQKQVALMSADPAVTRAKQLAGQGGLGKRCDKLYVQRVRVLY